MAMSSPVNTPTLNLDACLLLKCQSMYFGRTKRRQVIKTLRRRLSQQVPRWLSFWSKLNLPSPPPPPASH